MAEFAVVKQSQAPRRPTTPGPLRARMAEYEDYVASLKKGQAGRLVPAGSESVRAVAVRVSRAAKRIARPTEVWTVDGAVYFRPS
jgi:hypothetical protein